MMNDNAWLAESIFSHALAAARPAALREEVHQHNSEFPPRRCPFRPLRVCCPTKISPAFFSKPEGAKTAVDLPEMSAKGEDWELGNLQAVQLGQD